MLDINLGLCDKDKTLCVQIRVCKQRLKVACVLLCACAYVRAYVYHCTSGLVFTIPGIYYKVAATKKQMLQIA